MARQTRLEGAIIPIPKEGSIIEYYTQDADGNIVLRVKKSDGSVQDISSATNAKEEISEVGLVGATLKGEWDDSVTYIPNDIVTYNSSLFVCSSENIGVTPGSSTACWVLYVAKGNDGVRAVVKGEWTANTYYEEGDWVTHNGSLYVAIKNNNGSPITDTTSWTEMVSRGTQGDRGDGLQINVACIAADLSEVLAANESQPEGFTVFNTTSGELYVRVKLLTPINGEYYTWGGPIILKGTKGDPGVQGPPGPAPNIVIDHVATLETGKAASATVDNVDGVVYLSLGLPKGDQGRPFIIDVVGNEEDLHQYDNELMGFSFYAEDTGNIHIKKSNSIGVWCAAIHIEGPAGPIVNFSVDKVTTVEPDEDANVIINQNGEEAKVTFVIPRGKTGATGETGPSIDLEVGNVTTLPAGSQAVITAHQTGNKVIVDFAIPKGDTGDKGATGATGPSGAFIDGLKGALIMG